MSQEQPTRAKLNQAEAYAHAKGEPIKYGDVFNVQGELAREPIAPRDASLMQSAEKLVIGQTQKGGTAAVMQSAANRNERAGLVGHRDVSGLLADQGVSVTDADLPGSRVVTESVGGQVVGRYETPEETLHGDAIIRLEATVITAGGTERCTGDLPGDVATETQAAANTNQDEK
ncbi:putative Late embryogenesis abundant protein D-34 [Cocos nucifera]|uniref:Putative Late embryogenesis abundant protein D-34 n=1 Tax=Cocos nucifera TaxID=13894 RepID=A0A8K0II70_COCNU|nr:putative Late embryogenesis abundant protein D-34 [Cocos nucifera]